MVTPIDLITGDRTWESFSNIEVYGLDILNGVFLFSTTSGIKEITKYNQNNSSIKNPDKLLIKNSASKAWQALENKAIKEISDYKKRLDDNKVIPIILDPSVILTPQAPVVTTSKN